MLCGLVSFISSCKEEDGRTTFEGPFYVQFTSSSASISEAATSTAIVVEVSNVGPTLNSDIVVNYELTENATAVEGVDYAVASGYTSGEIVIPAGEHFGKIVFNTIDNEETDGVVTLEIELTSANQGLQAGRGAVGVSYALTITDDDCPLDLATFPGAYDMNFTHTAGFLWAAGFQEGFVATLSATATANIFDCENFFGIVDRDALGSLGSPSLGLIPIEIDEVAMTAGVSTDYEGTGHFFYFSGGTAEREIQAVSSGEIGTCGPSFSLAANLVRTADQSIGTSITEMNFTKIVE